MNETGISYDGGGTNPGPLGSSVYLPIIIRGTADNGGGSCITESGDVANDIDQSPPEVFSGQKLCGQVSNSDWDDVYRIYVTAGQQLSLQMTGSGLDADLYLFAPGTTSVNQSWYA